MALEQRRALDVAGELVDQVVAGVENGRTPSSLCCRLSTARLEVAGAALHLESA